MLFLKRKEENKEPAGTLNLNIQNEKYNVGDVVRGTLVFLTNKSYKVKQIKLEVIGVEKTVVHTDKASKRSSYLTKFGQIVGKSKKSDRIKNSLYIFYQENLSSFVKYINKTIDNVSNNDIVFLEDGTIEIPSGLRKEFPFQFNIPENALESYIGKNVSIEYRIKAVIDRSWKMDINSEKSFIVLNPYMKKGGNSKKENSLYKTNISILSSNISKNNTMISTTNEKDEQIAGEEYDEQERIKLETDKKVFSPGEIIKGNIYVNLKYYDVLGIEITLNAIERATPYYYKEESNWMTEVNKWIGGYIEDTIYEIGRQKFKINSYTNIEQNTYPFELRLPNNVKKSYRGKLSKYFYEIDAKINIPMAADKHIRNVIEVI